MKKKIIKYFFAACFCLAVFSAAAPALAQTTAAQPKGAFIPSCLLGDKINNQCDDVNIFIWLGLNIATYLFGFIGALALLFFVYGGIIMITSQGNKEKVKQGTSAITAAAIGLVIAFSGYMLVTFLGQTVGLKKDYQIKAEETQQK